MAWSLAVAALFCLWTPPASAQTGGGTTPPEPAATEEAPAPEQPKAVPLADLPTAVEEDARTVRALAEQLTATNNIEDWTLAANDLAAQVRRLTESPEMENLAALSLDAAQSARGRWASVSSLLKSAEGRIENRAAELAIGLGTLDGLSQRWALTIEERKEANVPDALRERITRVRNFIDETAGTYRERLDRLFKIESTLEEQAKIVSEQLGLIDARIEELRSNRLVKDQPAFWELWGAAEDPPIYEPVSAQVTRQIGSLREFQSEFRLQLVYQILLFVALWLAVAWVGRNTEPLAENDSGYQAYQAVLNHPTAVALILTLLSTPWFYPNAPRVVHQLAILGMVPPALFLTPKVTMSGHKLRMGALATLVGLFVVHRMGQVFLPFGLAERLLLLLLAAVSAPLLFRLYSDLAKAPSERRIRLNVVLKLFGIVAAASVVANVLGHVTLARLLINGVLTSLVLAVILNIGILAISGMIGALLRTPALKKLLIVRHHGESLRARVGGVFYFVGVALWILVTLDLFDLAQPLWNAVSGFVTRNWTVGSLSISLAGILLFLLIIWLGLKLAAMTRFVLQEDVFPRVKMARGVPQAITKLTSYGLVALAVIAAISASGLDLSNLALFAGALSLGIGFGLQNIVNNFVSGLILIFERPIEAGDTVELGTLTGQVTRIGIRSSTVRTYDGAEVIVPNADLISKEVINWTLSDRYRRLIVPVGVAYGSDPRQVLDLLVQVAREDREVLSFPEPYGLFRAFGASSLDFELRCWCKYDVGLGTSSRINVAINDALAEAGIEIPFPQQDLHVRSVDPQAAAGLTGQPMHEAAGLPPTGPAGDKGQSAPPRPNSTAPRSGDAPDDGEPN